jgi:hypothetical protein
LAGDFFFAADFLADLAVADPADLAAADFTGLDFGAFSKTVCDAGTGEEGLTSGRDAKLPFTLRLEKHSLQYTGLPEAGLNGTSQFFPQSAQIT